MIIKSLRSLFMKLKKKLLSILLFTLGSNVFASETPSSLKVSLPGSSLSAQDASECDKKAVKMPQSLLLNLTPVLECYSSKGDLAAMLSLALSYGEEGKLDLSKTIFWFQKAADAGSSFAMLQLGLVYLSPRNPSPNEELGFSWIKKAAEHGEVDAYIKLSSLYNDGIGTKRDIEKAKFWSSKAKS